MVAVVPRPSTQVRRVRWSGESSAAMLRDGPSISAHAEWTTMPAHTGARRVLQIRTVVVVASQG